MYILLRVTLNSINLCYIKKRKDVFALTPKYDPLYLVYIFRKYLEVIEKSGRKTTPRKTNHKLPCLCALLSK